MKQRHWLGGLAVLALLGLAGMMIPATAQDQGGKKKDDTTQKPPEKKAEEKKAEDKKEPEPTGKQEPKTDTKGGANPFQWKAFDGEKFYQELYTTTTQNMSVMGMPIKQEQEQWFYVSWTPGKKVGDNWVVTQEIVDVKMNIDIGGNKIEYDSLKENQPNNPMTDFFNKLRKLKLTYHISPKFTVEKIEGREAFVKELGGTNPQMEPLLKQILSEDALKQMAEPTWAPVPTETVKPGDTWKKTSTLNLGPIGTYNTEYTYKWDEKKSDKNKQVIDTTAELKYQAPMGKSGAGLPFVIVAEGTSLKSTEGKGSAVFDSDKGRIEKSDMTMKLEGTLVIEVSGMKTNVELKQDQSSRVRTMDSPEWKKK